MLLQVYVNFLFYHDSNLFLANTLAKKKATKEKEQVNIVGKKEHERNSPAFESLDKEEFHVHVTYTQTFPRPPIELCENETFESGEFSSNQYQETQYYAPVIGEGHFSSQAVTQSS